MIMDTSTLDEMNENDTMIKTEIPDKQMSKIKEEVNGGLSVASQFNS